MDTQQLVKLIEESMLRNLRILRDDPQVKKLCEQNFASIQDPPCLRVSDVEAVLKASARNLAQVLRDYLR